MKKTILVALCSVIAVCVSGSSAQDSPQRDKITNRMDSLKIVEAEVFAPKVYARADKSYLQASQAIEQNKKQQTIENAVNLFMESADNALKAVEVAKLSLSEHLAPRQRAVAAKAPMLAEQSFAKAEQVFVRATASVEDGNVQSAIKYAEKAAPLYETAEMEAIREDILGTADALMDKSIADDAGKFAMSTYNKAAHAISRADSILNADRYNRVESIEMAKLAEYEARHASAIAKTVRALERNDQAWEKLILLYEIQMQRVAEKLGMKLLPFDDGPGAAADSMITIINAMHDRDAMQNEILAATAEKLTNVSTMLGVIPDETDPVELAGVVAERVESLMSEKQELATTIENKDAELKELEQAHDEVASELEVRRDREEKFAAAKALINPSQGQVLYNATNDIVLRLPGLSFDVNSDDIKDEHVPLLTKVTEIISMFPNSKLLVEGHTDATGDAKANLRLSEKRAFSVMQYLRQAMAIPADRINSIGYGAERPVASNKTSEGRAKNRRIDIIILQ
ncbi:MAG: OmpA family protein [candidate division Zixibacteria bacterium]|nr:OmpA family protein [candidate division Zixibacteria bacterium]